MPDINISPKKYRSASNNLFSNCLAQIRSSISFPVKNGHRSMCVINHTSGFAHCYKSARLIGPASLPYRRAPNIDLDAVVCVGQANPKMAFLICKRTDARLTRSRI